MNNQETIHQTQQKEKEKPKQKKQEKGLISTFFRNALRSNLDLTSLADTKAGILISINGFILTVSVTASSFIVHNPLMTYAFIAIILTSLGSIILAVMAVKPRLKDTMVEKEHLLEYNSLLYYQDIADLTPKEYKEKTKKALKTSKKSTNEMINHLHILAAEIKQKYFWLKWAYTYFSLGLLISAFIIITALLSPPQTQEFEDGSNGNSYITKQFYNIFEPSGATTLPDGKILIVEDEQSAKSLKLIEFDENGNLLELGSPYMPKKIKKRFKKSVDDLEAITSQGNMIFTITSFSPTRENEEKKSRQKFIMLRYNDGAIDKMYVYKQLKKDLQNAFSSLFPHSSIFKSTINIEGLVYDAKADIIYLGFRSPLFQNKAILIGIKNYKDIFIGEEKPEFTKPLFINLQGYGIRGITYDHKKDGFWLIAGGTTNRDSAFELWFYDKGNNIAKKQSLPIEIGYAEGITLVNDEEFTTLFIVEDNGEKPNKPANYILIKKKEK